jgi:hypothetical protein
MKRDGGVVLGGLCRWLVGDHFNCEELLALLLLVVDVLVIAVEALVLAAMFRHLYRCQLQNR